jgi:hypothetical protein
VDFTGLYRAIVVNNIDPLGLQRLQISIPEFGPQPLAAWVLGCLPESSTALPDVGAEIWVGFEKGDRDYPVWLGVVAGVTTALQASIAAASGGSGSSPPSGSDSGSGDSTGDYLSYSQETAATSWVINYGFTNVPQVTVYDTAGTRIGLFGVVYAPDSSTVTLNFSAPFSGTAILAA